MNIFLLLGFIFAVIYSCVSWLLPAVLAWLFKRKFHIKLKIGRIAVPKLILKDVTLSKDGFSVFIKEVSFKSSFFNSDINKLVSVVIRDIQVTNNVEERKNVVVETILKPLLSKQNSTSKVNEKGDDFVDSLAKDLRVLSQNKILDFRDKKLPPSLIMFAQFMGVHIFNVSVTVYNGTTGSAWCLQATATEIHADGAAGGPARALVFSASLVDARARVLMKESQQCLAEASCSLLVEGTVKANGPLNVEKIHAAIANPYIQFQDDLYNFIEKQKKYRRPVIMAPVEPEDHSGSLIPRLSPVIPKIFSLKIDTTTVTCLDDNNQTNLKFSVQSLLANSRFSATSVISEQKTIEHQSLPQIYIAFQMDELQISTTKVTLVYLNKLKLDAKLEKGVLNLYLILSVLNITYNHDEVFRWYSAIAKTMKKSQPLEIKDSLHKGQTSLLERILSSCVVQGCAELRAARVEASGAGRGMAAGCAGLKLKLDQLLDTREEGYSWRLPRLLVGSRHWSTELLVDGGWLGALGAPGAAGAPGAGPEPPQRRRHSWGSALLAVALFKWGSHGPKDSKVEAMMDCLRFEWSPTIAQTIIAFIDTINEYRTVGKQKTSTEPVTESNSTVTVNVALSHINLFLIVSDKICHMVRVDAVSLEKSPAKFSAVVSGLKMVDLVPYKGPVICQRADEIQSNFCHIKLARIEYVPLRENCYHLDIQFLELVDIEWSVNMHLKVLTFVRDFNSFRKELKKRRREEESASEKKDLDWTLSFKNETNFSLLLSEENSLMLATDEATISMEHSAGLSISWGQVRGILNGDDVASVEGLRVSRLMDDQDVRAERKANEGFVLAWNQVWDINIGSFRLIFPYQHRFAEAIQGDLVSLVKWLKITHGIENKPFTASSPLPSDLYIKIEEVLIEMSDDPFEVKLRDNYELLEDEYKESQKRRTMLDAKVQELCKPHLFLPAGKVEELYAALREKDAQIYVQRCRAAPPPRTRLVACCLTRLRILALADPSLHGTENAIRCMREIDHDSPWPEEGVELSVAWCRGISAGCLQWQLLLRDFPQPLLSMSSLRLWGALLAAEERPPARALRTVTIEQGAPWGPCTLERSMMPLKWYYDLCCEISEMSYAFGPCWEPVIAQCNLAFDQVSRPSLDPSPPLAWWDKVRLLMHGRLTANFRRLTCLLHVSLDPYNTTEEMEITWADLVLDWTNGKIGFLGSLSVFARTASKYDDCRVLAVPALRLWARLGWRSAAPRDHRSAAPTAPAKRPDYSSNQEHDSYRAFRSHGLDLHISMETKPIENDGPVVLLYGSTLRWFESLKLILSGVTRPTRRGRAFGLVRPRKPQLSRHYRALHATLTLHDLQVFYWSSSSMQRGVEMLGGRLTCGSKHTLALVPCEDGLVRRPRAVWTTVYVNCDLNDAEIWLKAAAGEDKEKDGSSNSSVFQSSTIEKYYCVSVGRVWYGREAGAPAPPGVTAGVASGVTTGDAAHRLTVHNLRGAWTKQNRDLAFALFDTYIKTQQLKKNLSTKALKEDETTSPKYQRETDMVSPPPSAGAQGVSHTPGGFSTHANVPGGSGGASMLAALVAEGGGAAGGERVVLSDELAGEPPPLHAIKPLVDDSAKAAWIIELINSQVVLKGCETRGYVILCAARAEVRQRRQRDQRGATSAWSGALHAMQYYATVTGHGDTLDENIQWVCVEEISERCAGGAGAGGGARGDVPRLVGGGHAAGGVIGRTVGPSAAAAPPQLQRIVSRCACEFYYASTEEAEQGAGGAWAGEQQPYDCFTLVHHDLDVCTNSLQYAMVLDVVNNVVLYVEPERKKALERRARMRFQLQLRQDCDPRRLIHDLQTQVRESLARLRRLEKEYYMKNRSLNENDPAAIEELKILDNQVNECKESVWSLGSELDAMARAWRSRPRAPPPPRARAPPAPHRHNEICFKSARWRLTDADGQLGIADLLLTNFLYTKTSRSDDSVEHQLELGYVQVTNLLPNEPFPEVLVPQAAWGRAPLARRAALRVFCRDRPPVGGIAVKEHFEVNIVPIKIGLTKKFFNTMLKFCFPERDPDTIEAIEGDEDEGSLRAGPSTASLVSTGSKKVKKKGKDSNSNFYVKRDKKDKDDVEKMKERAEKNKLFIYIKIPEVPVRVSYKGSKEKNLEDVRDLPLVLPSLEYHNVTWTWLDLLLATKTDTRRVILSQAIRQKLQLHRRAAAPPEPHEEDKARLLLGERMVSESKPHKKSTPSVFKFSKS